YSIADRLTVTFRECDIDRKCHAWPRHQLPFKSIGVNINNARQHDQSGGVEAVAISGLRTNSRDQPLALVDIERGLLQISIQQYSPALDAHVKYLQANSASSRGIATKLSYFSRNPTASNSRKSASAARS